MNQCIITWDASCVISLLSPVGMAAEQNGLPRQLDVRPFLEARETEVQIDYFVLPKRLLRVTLTC